MKPTPVLLALNLLFFCGMPLLVSAGASTNTKDWILLAEAFVLLLSAMRLLRFLIPWVLRR
jgi:hypothetical protein